MGWTVVGVVSFPALPEPETLCSYALRTQAQAPQDCHPQAQEAPPEEPAQEEGSV